MDRLAAMQVFRAVVDSGSFAKAAEQLRISAATTSRNIADLERHLGVTLLRRSSRALLVCEAGQTYYEHCCDILDKIAHVEELAGQSKAAMQGRLRISIPASFGLRHVAPLLPSFMQRYPEVKIDICCSDRFVDFVENDFDIAIRVASGLNSNLIAKKLMPVRCVVSASPAYVARRGVPRTPEDLRVHDCLSYAHAAYGDTWKFVRFGAEHTVSVRSVFRSDSGDVIRQACLGGCGIAIQPTFLIADDLRSGALLELLEEYRFAEYNVYAVYPAEGRNSARTRAFVDFLREAFEAA